MWLAPPGDMARPVWRDVLEWTQLGPEERSGCLGLGGTEVRRTQQALGPNRGQRGCPADLAGGWRARTLSGRPGRRIRSERTAFAPGPEPGPRIAVSLRSRSRTPRGSPSRWRLVTPAPGPASTSSRCFQSPEQPDTSDFSAGELALLGPWSGPVATGVDGKVRRGQAGSRQGRRHRPRRGDSPGRSTIRRRPDRDDGRRGECSASGLAGESLRVQTARRGEHVWAWTLGERASGS